MSFLDQFTQSSAEYSSSGSSAMESFFGAGGETVTSSNAQKIAAVFSCVNIKANALSVIPIKTYLRTNAGKEEDFNNPLYNLLRYEPNHSLTASLYKKMISQDFDLRGNHYSQIVRNGLGQVVALYPLISDKMEVTFDDKNKKVFKYNNQSVAANKILHLYDIPDAIGLKGVSKIEYAKQTLMFAKNTAAHGNKLFQNSATPSGSFEMAGSLDDVAFERLKQQLSDKYTGISNTGKPMLLEDGLTFKPMSISNSDSEWLESRKFNRQEIASIFGVPVAMLNDASNTAYGNLEQKYLEFYSGTIFPLTTILEEQFRLSLLLPQNKATTSIKFKYNTMLRVDTKTRADYYKTRFNVGSISPNEIRAYEDENSFDGGDERYVQLNLSTVKNLNKGVDNNG